MKLKVIAIALLLTGMIPSCSKENNVSQEQNFSTVSQTITRADGGVIVHEAGAVMRIVRGAVTSDTQITVDNVPQGEAPEFPTGYTPVGAVFRFSPFSVSFLDPPEVEIAHAGDAGATIFYAPSDSSGWQQLSTYPNGIFVKATAGGLGYFAAGVPASGGISGEGDGTSADVESECESCAMSSCPDEYRACEADEFCMGCFTGGECNPDSETVMLLSQCVCNGDSACFDICANICAS